MNKASEAALVARVALLGDKQAFGTLAETYEAPIRRFLHHLCGDEELSKDLAQEAFVKAWLNIASFRAAARFSTWLHRIAYNEFLDDVRTQKLRVNIDSVAGNLAATAHNSDRTMDFARALATLSGNEKTAMLLFYMEDFTVQKIEQIMNCPAGTVKSLLHRGKEKLADYLKNSGYDK
ncbi:RNA polymerase sigma factor [Bacteroidia bacterium]|nr:RNA polymerase sigma factor [Bacteroidia bacterium]